VTAPARSSAPPPCPRCAPLASELADVLRQLEAALGREGDLLAALREWNTAAAAALDGRGEVQP